MGILSVADFQRLASDGKNITILDARGGANAYDRFKAGHIKGALYADLETELSHKTEHAANGGRHPLPSPFLFSQFLAEKGITPSSTVVIYDDKNGGNAAARLWWMFTSAGHEEVYVLNGGLQAAAAEGIEMEVGEAKRVTDKSTYTFVTWLKPTVTMEDVARAAEDDQFLVIDVRENYRFRGEGEPIDLVAGHIPGAVNVPYLGNLDEEGKFLDAQLLRDKYSKIVGGRDIKNVYVHCGSGVTACHTLLALSDAGFGDASLYVGSWSEWSRNDRPVGSGD